MTNPSTARARVSARLLAGIAVLLAIPGARADEGRIPITQPAVIVRPGSYFLAWPLTIGSGIGVDIQASDVTLDLNGQAINATTSSATLIHIADGATGVRIRNGRLAGGSRGIAYGTAATPPPVRLYLRDLDFARQATQGLDVSGAEYVEVVACRFKDSTGGGAQILGGAVAGRVTDSIFIGLAVNGLVVDSVRQFLVRDNVFSGIGGASLAFVSGSAALVDTNTFTSPAAGTPTFGIDIEADGVLVQNNELFGYSTGIGVASRGNRILHNVVRGGVGIGGSGAGIRVSVGSDSLLFRNQIEGNAGCGIELDSGSAGNAYRRNMLRGNAGGGVCDSGAGNIDGGGNIL